MTNLENIKKMDMKINFRLDDIKEQRNKLYKITSVLKDNEVQESKTEKSPLEKAIVRLVSEEEDLNKMIDTFVDYKNEMLEMLETIENEDYRRILYLRYFKYYSWEKISQVMDLSVNHLYKIHRSTIKSFSKC